MFSIEFRCCASQPASQPVSQSVSQLDETFHFGILMFSKLTLPHATTSSGLQTYVVPAACRSKRAGKSIYRISMKTTYSTFWPKTWELCLACRSDLPLLFSVFGQKFASCCRSAAL